MPVLHCRIPKAEWAPDVGERNGVSLAPSEQPAEQSLDKVRPWAPAIGKIIELGRLGEDWDGLGARAPLRELLESAVGLAYLLCAKGVAPPHCVVPGLDGSVNLEWQDLDGTIAEVEIDRPFHAEVMVIEAGQPPRFWDLPTS